MQQMAQQTQEMEQRLQKEMAESRTDMADMAQSLRTEMKAMLQNEMQDSLAPIMQWRDHIDTKLTAYDVTLADYTTSHNAVQQEVSALADRLDSLAPSIQDVMTQLEATGDTAKDIRAELADAAQNIRAELAEQERRLNDLHTRMALAATPDQLDERELRLRENALKDRRQLQALERQVEGQQETLAQVASIAAQVERLAA